MHLGLKCRNAFAAAVVAVFVGGGTAGAAPEAGGPADPTDNAGSRTFAAQPDIAAVLAYWTPERMAAAVPVDAPATSGKAPISLRRTPEDKAWGQVDGAEPRGGVPMGAADIHSMSGRVFFTSDQGGNFSCSGSTVNSNGKRVVFTAGHCVHGGGAGRGWHYNWVFVPAYHAGSPYGVWTSYQLWTKTGWINNADRAYDVAAAVMNPLNGVRIVDAVGGQGIKWGIGYGQYIYQFGYPADPPYNGSQLYYCAGTTWNESGFPTISCSMTGGASGGPWLESYGQTFWAYLYSVNSWQFWNPDPTHVYKWQGPYFSYDTAGSLYDLVKDM
ncbi:trypsin-like serine peptidase [Corallococcus carmarthensis]|uniref:trypsin-like serine peptidase n=1 Tax=Corallococcus carmarthensis TaxID=2316728 RepID=UPI00148CD0CC|nr:peptidase [Corallococcus carmarthensis]NOK22912.1 peptidase [Corallococcus carmarthensis]